ncbi:MAG: hypothetical protein KA717_32925 [Woronichinia naegeliana WA131]|jgi:hypothetical protein|uniref:Uncharacterized protein n=1 Tax=Woronichinia naegeliana WA131 TaxID=2824559 RepID=A0A977KUU4_9CYAN|nr:MAG: hypothetical protein KA717_32925 [Woronichinia naegeliana WA131]
MINPIFEKKFLEALDLCNSLSEFARQPSSYPCQAIHLFCEIGTEPENLLELNALYADRVLIAKKSIEKYARTIDNWKTGNCPLGGKDHCNIVNFFLSLKTQDFYFFRGDNFTPELICEFLQEWKGINLFSLITNSPQLVTH